MALHEHTDGALFLVVAAGRGARAGAGGPKQYRELAGRQVLTRTLEALLGAEPEARALVVIHRDDLEFYNTAIAPLPEILRARLHAPAFGGETRQDSVCNGLEALAAIGATGAAPVLIHDAARPFVGPDLIRRALDVAWKNGAGVPGVSVTDTIKQTAEDGRIVATPDRATLRAVQTPQAFRFDLIHGAHRAARDDGRRDLTPPWRNGPAIASSSSREKPPI
jgi:2-C-methyl-D-erythritol 4-phosphate cytidylyltransferase/2-C-methyl-D-erythritol 2,4-cyclodiphosphate synthase